MNEPPASSLLPASNEHQQQLLLRQPFNPLEHGLEASWRLTKFSDLKG